MQRLSKEKTALADFGIGIDVLKLSLSNKSSHLVADLSAALLSSPCRIRERLAGALK